MLQHERNAPIAVTTLADRNASVVAVRTSWRMNLSIIDLAFAASYLEDRRRTIGRIMKTIHKGAIATTVAFSALAFATMTGSTAQAGPIVPPGRYCLSYDEGGTDCSFTRYAQCLATASGLAAECYGKTVRDDENDTGFQVRGHRGSELRTPHY